MGALVRIARFALALGVLAACGTYGEEAGPGGTGDGGTGDGGTTSPGVCGDGKRTADEACDGADLGEASCASAAAPGWIGKPSCTATCALDPKDCTTPASTYAPLTAPSFLAFDTVTIHADARGFRGAAFDGRYVYFVPYDNNLAHGRVARYDVQGGFKTTSSWTTFDVSTVNAAAKGFLGGAFDGRYIYLVPKNNGIDDGVVARYDTRAGFGASASWSTFDAATVHPNAKGFVGAVFDGRYLYFVPNEIAGASSGLLARYDTRSGFDGAASWATFDTTILDANAEGFAGAAFDGRYLYLVPIGNGLVTRYDTTADLRATTSWSTFDMTSAGSTKAFYGAAFDGRYVYFVPSSTGLVTRYDTTADFRTAGSYTSFDATTVNGGARGFRGATFDGRHIYFVPYINAGTYHGILARYDTTVAFDAGSSWGAFDVASIDARAKGLFGGVFDGKYVYLVPYVTTLSTATIVTRFEAKSPSWLPLRWNASFL